MKKYALLSITIIISTNFIFAKNNIENDLWTNLMRGNYKNAGDLSREIGKTKNEYYAIAAVCYYNINDYFSSQITNHTFKKKNNITELRKLLEAKEKKYSNNYQMYLLMAIVKKFNPEIKLRDSEYYCKKSINLNSNNPIANNELSILYSAKGDLKKTIKYAKIAISQLPTYPEPYNNLAFAYYKFNNKNKAIDYLIQCLKNCNSVPSNTFQSLASLNCTNGVNTIAPNGNTMLIDVPVFRNNNIKDRIISAAKEKPSNFLRLVEFFINNGENKQFYNEIKNIKVSKDLRGFLSYIKAKFYYLEGNNKKYILEVENIIKFNFDDSRKLLNVGYTLQRINKINKAITIYNQALNHIDPLDYEYKLKILSNIGSSYLVLKKYKDALSFLHKAIDLNPYDTISLLNCGISYYSLKNNSESKKYLERALNSTKNKKYIKDIKYWIEKVK